jgi:hypothetical protein
VFSRDAANHYDELQKEYLSAYNGGDRIKAEEYASKMEKVKFAFKEQKDSAAKLKAVYDAYETKDKAGTLSDYDRGRWKMVKGLYEGDTKKTFLNYNKDDIRSEWFSSELGENGEVNLRSVTVGDIDAGLLAPLDKLDVDGKNGVVDSYVSKMGELTKEWYSKGRDRKTVGYNTFAEQKLNEVLNTDFDENEIKDLAAQFNIATSGLEDKDKFVEAKKKVIEQLRTKIMGAEEITDSSKLNTDEAELALKTRKQAFDEAEARKPKTVAKGSEEEKLGIRKQNISDVIRTGNTSDFSSGDIEWAGKKYRVTGSKLSADGKNMVLSVQDEKGVAKPSITVEKTEAGLNELYNAFEKTNWTMDKVQLVEPVVWRNVDEGSPSIFSSTLLSKFEGGNYKSRLMKADDGNFVDDLKTQYPNLDVSNNYLAAGDITVEGQPIYIDGKTIEDVEAQIKKAAGNKIKGGTKQVDEYGIEVN